MLRFVRVTGVSSGESRILYRVKNAKFLSAYKYIDRAFSTAFAGASFKTPIAFRDSIAIDVPSSNSADGRYYEAILYVSENQPTEEAVEEVTSYGVVITVFNEYGTVVCDNGVTAVSNTSTPTVSGGPGEMTSEPIDGPGEML